MVVALMFCMAAAPASAPTPAQKKLPLPQAVKAEIAGALDALEKDGEFDVAKEKLDAIFDRAVVMATPTQTEAIRDAAFARRLVRQVEQGPRETKLELLKFLRSNDDLARAMVFLVREEKCIKEYALLDRLRRERPKQLNHYANLAAAICVVHEEPFERGINENKAKSADALAIYDYYVKHEGAMFFGIKPVPAELLVFVVDTTASVEEMQWALEKYAGDAKVGGRFFDIKYDIAHYRRGTPKRITELGFNLPNILAYGGVCADQAYFAMTVGKSIGVPTAYTVGSAADVGHAWVGFLQAAGNRGWWNFDIGRYEAYQGVQGRVLDPQTRKTVPDAYVSLLAELIGTKATDRHLAVALSDAAARLLEWEAEGKAAPTYPADPGAVTIAKPRTADVKTALALLELGVKSAPGDRHVWLAMAELAGKGKMTLEQKRSWASLLQRVCGAKYPDFTLAVLVPMVGTVEDVKEQNRLWDAALPLFQQRADLSAYILMRKAELLEKEGKHDAAGQMYFDIVAKYAGAGPFALEALVRAEKALVRLNRAEKTPELYAQAWAQCKAPKDMFGEFMTQSNWYRVGDQLAKKLENAGQTEKAAAVKAELAAKTGEAPAAGGR